MASSVTTLPELASRQNVAGQRRTRSRTPTTIAGERRNDRSPAGCSSRGRSTPAIMTANCKQQPADEAGEKKDGHARIRVDVAIAHDDSNDIASRDRSSDSTARRREKLAHAPFGVVARAPRHAPADEPDMSAVLGELERADCGFRSAIARTSSSTSDGRNGSSIALSSSVGTRIAIDPAERARLRVVVVRVAKP